VVCYSKEIDLGILIEGYCRNTSQVSRFKKDLAAFATGKIYKEHEDGTLGSALQVKFYHSSIRSRVTLDKQRRLMKPEPK